MTRKKSKSHLPLRLNILFFAIFLLFSMLILQLGVVQILYGQDAQEELDRTERVVSETPVPRGKLYDRNGNLLVDNEAKFAITYTPQRNVQPEDNLEVARKLEPYIEMDTSSVNQRSIEDYWILLNREEAYSRLSDEEKEQSDRDQYYSMLDKIEEEDLEGISEKEMEIIAIKHELDQAYELTPRIIKKDNISKEEYAVIAENLGKLPGINVTTDWEREYLYDGTFRNYIGSLTTAKQGLPRTELDYYMSRNYSRNDRVGRSGLEEQYELLLSGKKEIREHITNANGQVINSNLIREGERGKDLRLSVDIELQEQVDEIVRDELQNAINQHPYENRYLKDAMVVMMDPNTGELLAVSGQSRSEEDGEDVYRDESFRAFYDSHLPGSTVKGATVLAGYESGVLSVGETMRDRPITISTDTKGSYRPIGTINDLGAIKQSSNVYMFFVGLRLGGEFREKYNFDTVTYNREGFYELQSYFAQFGLGVETRVDFPFEEDGVEGNGARPGDLMDLAIGQNEAYTALQMAQYVSTIANGGYRMQPHLVSQIHQPTKEDSLGPIYEKNEPTVLNRIDMEDRLIERVQEGFRQVMQESGGTAYRHFNDAEYEPAGKTGTAQEYVYPGDNQRIMVYNLSLVGYAPHDEPEVAFSVLVPYTGTDSEYQINKNIGRRILDAYFDLKEKRQTGAIEEAEEEQEEEETETDTTE
ncbi:penicillin-binding protein 2 [Halalkalibacillus sediminis]|uniref:serine-type D-Ala-D-Ala carboxypeptidase n=1 Tax=Halalkalibacillus sediminis TaxID=2018042 RepID=A0A2I0QXG3_9BACI|nr:penicillin-binding protein 2 [Halalkalibacillus sediminis]PKR78998.1 penicillin-binding protein 2 [Halalkalibacillus sediminis]